MLDPAVNDRLPWLQVLRAFAALSVVLFHFIPLSGLAQAQPWITSISVYGVFGVDLFFVLSGFVVTCSAMRVTTARQGAQFFVRRVARIYAGYWPVLAALVLLLTIGLPDLTSTARAIPSVVLTAWRLEENMLPVAWSLTFELWFYACVGVIFVLTASRKARMVVVGAAIVSLIGWHAFAAFSAFAAWSTDTLPFPFLLSGLAIEFWMGSLTALVLFGRPPGIRRAWLGGAMVALGLSALVLIDLTWLRLSSVRAASVGVASVGLLLLALHWGAIAKETKHLHPPKIAVALGDASYSIYLLHPLLIALYASGGVALHTALGSMMKSVDFIVVPASIALLAVLWFRAIERPLTASATAWSLRRLALG